MALGSDASAIASAISTASTTAGAVTTAECNLLGPVMPDVSTVTTALLSSVLIARNATDANGTAALYIGTPTTVSQVAVRDGKEAIHIARLAEVIRSHGATDQFTNFLTRQALTDIARGRGF